MGGLFGKKGKLRSLFGDGSWADTFSAAQARLAGDHGAASAIHARADDRRIQRAKLQAARQARQAAYAWAKRQGYSEEEAAALANDPEVISNMIADRDKVRQFDSGGGAVARRNPTTGQLETEYEAPRRDSDGNRREFENGQGDPYRGRPSLLPTAPVPRGPSASVISAGPPATAPRIGQVAVPPNPIDNLEAALAWLEGDYGGAMALTRRNRGLRGRPRHR